MPHRIGWWLFHGGIGDRPLEGRFIRRIDLLAANSWGGPDQLDRVARIATAAATWTGFPMWTVIVEPGDVADMRSRFRLLRVGERYAPSRNPVPELPRYVLDQLREVGYLEPRVEFVDPPAVALVNGYTIDRRAARWRWWRIRNRSA